MAVHGWTRVGAGTFHHFHATWIIDLKPRCTRGCMAAAK